MIYIKTYCYSEHELPFVITQLEESYDYIDKLILYEYNYTHTGQKKEYNMEKVIHLIPEEYKEKLDYKKIDLSNYHVDSKNNEKLSHSFNEIIQKNWLFNDKDYVLKDEDIIFDIDIDEIIYKDSYEKIINEMKKINKPISIKLNQFFFKNNYLWKNIIFTSPTVYKYSMVKNDKRKIKDLRIKDKRDQNIKTKDIHGCHMSWVMPIEYMINKINVGAHRGYKHLAKKEILQKAVDEKKYVFDLSRPFDIGVLEISDPRIPKYLQRENIFDFL